MTNNYVEAIAHSAAVATFPSENAAPAIAAGFQNPVGIPFTVTTDSTSVRIGDQATAPAGATAGGETVTTVDLMSLAKQPLTLPHLHPEAITPYQLQTFVDGLVKQRNVWEATLLSASNAALHDLLESCHSLYVHTQQYTEVRTEFLRLFNNSNIPATKGTSLITKIVRYVFGIKAEKRVFAYAKVLQVFIDEKPQNLSLTQFIQHHGGIEEIRRNGTKTKAQASEKKAKISNTIQHLKKRTAMSATFQVRSLPGKQGGHNLVALLGRYDDQGQLCIVHASNRDAIIEAMILEVASKEPEAAATNEQIAASDDTDAAIQAALNA